RFSKPYCLAALAAAFLTTTTLSADVISYDISAAAKLAASAGTGAGANPGAGAGAEGQPGTSAGADPAAAQAAAAGFAGAAGAAAMLKPAVATLRITLQGEATVQGRLVTYRHATVKDQLAFHLDVDPIEVVEAPTLVQTFNKRFGQAGKD